MRNVAFVLASALTLRCINDLPTMRLSFIVCTCLLVGGPIVQALPPSPVESNSSIYRSKPLLLASYFEGYSTALREQLIDLVYGSASIVNHGTPRTEKELAWFSGYRDGIKEGSKLAQKFYERQLREPKDGE